MFAIAGIILIVAGAWSDFAHKNHLTPDIRYAGIAAMLLGGVMLVAWLGGLMRF
jgi:hypothetical protein